LAPGASRLITVVIANRNYGLQKNYNYLVNLLYIRLSSLKFVESIKSGFVFKVFYFATPSTLLHGAAAPLLSPLPPG
jgi:hypothetical protein